MVTNFYNKRNNSNVQFFYPVHGSRNILRKVEGVKIHSFTGPDGRGITVLEKNGEVRRFSLCKIVSHL